MLLKDANPGFRNLKDFVQTDRDAYPYKCNEIILARSMNEKAAYIFVEGPSDQKALLRHRATNCTISPLNINKKAGKKGVIDFIKCCETFLWKKNVGLRGIVGLVDKDFDDHLNEKPRKPPKRAPYISSVTNDLESTVLYFSEREILKKLLANQQNKINDWLDLSVDCPEAFDRLVHCVVAPIGALRVAWQNSGLARTSLNLNDVNVISRIWNSANHSQSLNSDDLINLLPSQYSNNEKHRVKVLIQKELDKINKQPALEWNYVRGKDLVYSIACALANSSRPLDEHVHLITKLIIDGFDSNIIAKCKLKQTIAEATIGDHGNWQYLK